MNNRIRKYKSKRIMPANTTDKQETETPQSLSIPSRPFVSRSIKVKTAEDESNPLETPLVSQQISSKHGIAIPSYPKDSQKPDTEEVTHKKAVQSKDTETTTDVQPKEKNSPEYKNSNEIKEAANPPAPSAIVDTE